VIGGRVLGVAKPSRLAEMPGPLLRRHCSRPVSGAEMVKAIASETSVPEATRDVTSAQSERRSIRSVLVVVHLESAGDWPPLLCSQIGKRLRAHGCRRVLLPFRCASLGSRSTDSWNLGQTQQSWARDENASSSDPLVPRQGPSVRGRRYACAASRTLVPNIHTKDRIAASSRTP
jgi:hypothetical protein